MTTTESQIEQDLIVKRAVMATTPYFRQATK
jgi:hypothetical protein